MKTPLLAIALVSTLPCGAALAFDEDMPRTPSVPAVAIQWGECDATQVLSEAFVTFGERMRCGQLTAPLDHHRPAEGSIDIGLIRIAAGNPEARKGALFFNPGGPGINPMHFMPVMGLLWDEAIPDDPVHGTKKQLSDAYDLIGVIPRGLRGGTQFNCEREAGIADYNDIVADRSEANIQAMDRTIRANAAACRRHPFHTFISTEQTVYDMDLVRRSLGEPRLNYLGISYGTWLGTWYAATYPQHVGHMVLDSSMDWTVSFASNLLAGSALQQARFDRLVARPTAADPRYGLGSDAAAVTERVRGLLLRVREAWANEYRSPASLLAAIAASDLLRALPDIGQDDFKDIILDGSFHPDPTVDADIRKESLRLVHRYFETRPSSLPRQVGSFASIFAAVSCNDDPSDRDAAPRQAWIADVARLYPASSGSNLQYTCVFWGGPSALRPPQSRLAGVGNLLMVHSELDSVTSLQGAAHALEATPNAKMIIATDFDGHGLFGWSDSACVEDAVGTYLLHGTMPSERLTRCALPSQSSGISVLDGFRDAARARRWRDHLSAFLQAPYPQRDIEQ